MSNSISRNEIFLGGRNTNLDKQKEHINSLRQSICEVKSIAKNNIRKVAERDEKLEILSKSIDNFKETTEQFSNNATKLKKKMITQMYNLIFVVAVVFVLIACGILFSIKLT
ncbi:Synaptobrevin domain-containing protein [Strongyloides ratti]|uniref:Synaptobrevin domain-containing protein n=1 Tax=Strongyloides ratti TaxID=34506 RepID=A0A090LC98_STRRB|nr:Synaptobrevin domain-containing protein [Strongyloides ratti]CEF67426.1 Synaptobrevin domain-containing protein [Strongyloides ratti]